MQNYHFFLVRLKKRLSGFRSFIKINFRDAEPYGQTDECEFLCTYVGGNTLGRIFCLAPQFNHMAMPMAVANK
jgi:hypothetical protein